ncbi:hypothetical protein NL676_018472 [Syzygium grande]|nr:hypothetical protein NL676_018472 [Syzygium grande]
MGQQVQSTAKGALASRGWSSNSRMGAASSAIGSRSKFSARKDTPWTDLRAHGWTQGHTWWLSVKTGVRGHEHDEITVVWLHLFR